MITLTRLNPETHEPLQQWNFSNKSVIRIGRFRDNDIVVAQYLQVSRHHLELRQVDNSGSTPGWQLISQGTNGTFLNGKLVKLGSIDDDSFIRLAKDGPLFKVEIQSVELSPQSSPQKSSLQKNNDLTSVCSHVGNSPQNLFCIHCGKPLVDTEDFIHQYQILRIIGRGGMGTTYLAWDKSATTDGPPLLLALKEMNADMAQIAKARELFEREARILKSLKHPGIPKYYDFFVENNKKYLAMEIIHGQNLEQLIYKYGPVTLERGIRWMLQVCDILKYLHSLDPPLIHRDVKPANLMIRNLDSALVLLDFGAVKEIGTPPVTRIGAEGYSAPEQNRGKPCTQSDIYAIAPTLIFLLTGEEPLQYFKRKRTGGYYFDLSDIPNITPELSKVIDKACEPKLSTRYKTVSEISQALENCL